MNSVCTRFLGDENVNRKVIAALRDRGIDAVHAIESGLAGLPDAEIMAAAIDDERIVITRDYADFGTLVDLYSRWGIGFPGVLFISSSIPHGDVGGLLQAVEVWIELCESGRRSVRNTAGWLILPGQEDGFDRRVREATEPYLAVIDQIS
jgi:predicted nuclease of predicted toxin-antitoxin system